MDCKVCFESFNEGDRRPRNLPCGHTFCTGCINNVLKFGNVNCPTCRMDHPATQPTQFPVNFGMEELIANINAVGISSEDSVWLPQDAEGLSHEVQSLVSKQESTITHMDLVCKDTVNQLDMYESQLVDWLDDHEQLLSKLNELVEENSTLISNLQSEKDKLQETRDDVKAKKTEQLTIKRHLASATTSEQATTICSAAEIGIIATEALVNNCQRSFPDMSLVCSSQQVREYLRYIKRNHDSRLLSFPSVN